MTVHLYDTTLRDGAQGEGVSFSIEDKLKITHKLDELGIQYIEGGSPVSNPKDIEYFDRVHALPLKNSIITAFSYTVRVGVAPEDDTNLSALLAANTEVLTIVGKSWDLHVHEVLRTNLDENLRMIHDTLRFLKMEGRRVFYDAEQFFDGFKANPTYTLETLEAAADGGAELIILCDTNGGSMPWEIEDIMCQVQKSITIPLGIHAHNDCGVGVANTLAAVRCGAVQVQGTINGCGERVGNADLCSIIPTLKLKMGINCISDEQLSRLTEVSLFVSELANLPHNSHAPYVGMSAFAHKAGLHADATMKYRESYQHIRPELVGNRTRVLVSELSGKGSVLLKAGELGLTHDLSKEEARRVAERIKELENVGFSFEHADASVELLIRRERDDYKPSFKTLDLVVVAEHRRNRNMQTEARIKLRVNNRIVHTSAIGRNPVDALDTALRKALVPFYPVVEKVQRIGYKVHILHDDPVGAATTRVFISSSKGNRSWSIVGCSPDIIEAIWQALVDSLDYALLDEIAIDV